MYQVHTTAKVDVYKVADPSFPVPYKLNINRYFSSTREQYGELFKEYYLSPTQLLQLSANNPFPKQNFYKSDVFCLGVVVLSMMLQENAYEIYNAHTLSINNHKLQEYLSALDFNYSDSLTVIVNQMLDLNENYRPDFLELDTLLSKRYPDRILSRTKKDSFLFTTPFVKQTDDSDISDDLNDQNQQLQSNFQYMYNRNFQLYDQPTPDQKQVLLRDDLDYQYIGSLINGFLHGKGIILNPNKIKIVDGEFYQGELYGLARVWNE